MRMLLLCFATFAAGLLAGHVFWPDAAPSRSESRSGPGFTEDRIYAGGGNGAGAPDDDGPDASRSRTARNADVRALTREAKRELDRVTSTPTAQAVMQGDGKIEGTVRDPAGQGVAGVVITAIPDAQPRRIQMERRAARQQSHKDRDLSEVAGEAIELELWRRYARKVATTGPGGKFKLEGMMDGMFTLHAYHDDYDVRPLSQGGRVQPDAVVDFLARPAAQVRVDVRMSDGSVADYAWIPWRTTAARGQESWMKENPVIRLPVGAVTVRAQKWVPEASESEDVEVQVRGDGGENAPIVLTMKERRVLTAKLTMPEGFVLPRSVEYRLRALDGGTDVEPESLLKGPNERRAWSRTPGVAHWVDLEPGRYMVAVFLEKRRLIGHATVDVTEGTTEVDVPVEAPAQSVTVRLLDPDGGPVPGQASFRVVITVKGRQRNQRADALQLADGAWAVFLDGIEAGDGETQLRVGTRYGGAVERVNLRGGGTITIRLDKPAIVTVNVDRYQGSGGEGILHAALRGNLGADAWARVGANGEVQLRGVQPGDYKLQLWLRKWNRNWNVFSRPIRLRSGDEEQRVTMPQLHTLNVRWAGKGRPRNAVLRCRDGNLAGFRRDTPLRGNKGSFPLLAAGQYQVEIARRRVEVRVPSPEVVIQ